jgi:DNA recombination protein Rad52
VEEMTFTPEQVAMLSAKLDKGAVKSRSRGGRSVSYIEGWHAIDEANRIFGFGGWQRETIDIRVVSEKPRKIGESAKDGWGVSYVARVRITVGDIVREGVGAGHGIDVDLGQAHESAIKEAETDAMKRALMTFGNPFGLALYDKTQANVGDPDEPERAPVRVVTGRTVNDLPPEPTESEKRIAEGLKTAIGLAASPTDLEKWKRDPDNVKLFGMLPTLLRVEVQAFATKHLKSLQEHEPVLMAG